MTPPAAPLAVADRTLLAALRGWSEDFDPSFWNCFEPGWRQSLQAGWNEWIQISPEAARDRVRLEHQAQAHPDWSRIHPSWWLRALKEESPAVQRAVVAHAPRAIQGPLQAGLGLSDQDLQVDAPPHPEALSAALTLWSERLVGDQGDRDDPPVILALTQLDLSELTQLIAATGLAKWTISGATPSLEGAQARVQALHLQARAAFTAVDSALKALAHADVAQYGQGERDQFGSIGLVTFARLLEFGEPYRVRWALQHLPYKVAKLLRALMGRTRADPNQDASAVLRWESAILDFAWGHLRDQGRVKDPRGAAP